MDTYFKVLADTAHKVEKVAREIYSDNSNIESKKKNLCKYFNELNDLMQSI